MKKITETVFFIAGSSLLVLGSLLSLAGAHIRMMADHR